MLTAGDIRVEHAEPRDVAAIAALNNRYAPDELTLPRTEAFVEQHLADYQVVRDADGTVIGCVALDEYSPSLAELISLAVAPGAQGRGIGRRLIEATEELARQRGHHELFAVSLSDRLFQHMGFERTTIDIYPEKVWRYATISRSELSIGRKFCFRKQLQPVRAAAATPRPT